MSICSPTAVGKNKLTFFCCILFLKALPENKDGDGTWLVRKRIRRKHGPRETGSAGLEYAHSRIRMGGI